MDSDVEVESHFERIIPTSEVEFYFTTRNNMGTCLQGALSELEVLEKGCRVSVQCLKCCPSDGTSKLVEHWQDGTIERIIREEVAVKFDDVEYDKESRKFRLVTFSKDHMRPKLNVGQLSRTVCLQNYAMREVLNYTSTGQTPTRHPKADGLLTGIEAYRYVHEPHSVLFGMSQNVWSDGIFAFLSPNEVTAFSMMNRSSLNLVECIRQSMHKGNSRWSYKNICILKEDFSEKEMVGYEGPYYYDTDDFRADVYHVHRVRTVRFLVRSHRTREIFELKFRSGAFLWSEKLHSGERIVLSQVHDRGQSDQGWVDCTLKKKIKMSTNRIVEQVTFQTIPHRGENSHDWIRTGFRLHNGISSRVFDLGACGMNDCNVCSPYGDRLNDRHLADMSLVSESTLRMSLSIYAACALRLDILPRHVTGKFPRAGTILKNLPPLLLHRYVVDSVLPAHMEIVCGPEPTPIPWYVWSRIPCEAECRHRVDRRKARRRHRHEDTCWYEEWFEFDFADLPWFRID